MATEYHVFSENGEHISGPHRKEEVAERSAERARAQCPCGTDGNEGECGVLSPHGVSVAMLVDGYWANR